MITTKELERYTALYDNERMNRITNAILTGNQEELAKAKRAINRFIFAPDYLSKTLGAKTVADIQNFTTKGIIPDVNTNIQKIFNRIVNYDDRYKNSFDEWQFDDGRDYLEVLDVNNGITFKRLPEGAKVPIERISGSVAIIKATTYAAGIGWTFEMLEDRKFSQMVKVAEAFRDSWYARLSRIHYAVLTEMGFSSSNANSGSVIPFSLPATDPDALRIMRTIDTAANMIGNAVKDLGLVPDPAIAPINVYVNPQHYLRVYNAVNPTPGYNTQQYGNVVRQINVYPTYNLIRANGTPMNVNEALVVLPGGKNITATKLPPTEYMRTDIESFSQIMTVRARIAIFAGEPRQFVRISLT